MALKIEQKKEIVARLQAVVSRAASIVLADTSGISVAKMTLLRQQSREASVQVMMVRNTLSGRALEGTPYSILSPYLIGPCLFGFSMDHPGAAARIFSNFAKETPQFALKAAAFNGQVFLPENIQQLASLPTYEEALAKLLSVFKEVSGGKLARTLLAVREKLQAAA